MSEIFEDITDNGKVRPWRERKIENVRYAEYLAILEFKRAHDIRGCGEVLRFRKIGDHLKLYQTWFSRTQSRVLRNQNHWLRLRVRSNEH